MKKFSVFMESIGDIEVDDAGERKSTTSKRAPRDDKKEAEMGEEVADDIKYAAIESFINKLANCQTLDGLDEFEDFYYVRRKEVKLLPSDDIQIRDAISGRREQLEFDGEDDEVEIKTKEDF